MKLIVISICKDEAETIGKVLDAVPTRIEGITSIEKWVIDDGSTDQTSEVAKKHGAKVQTDGTQKGLANRFREALDIALSNSADILVNIDGDLQFDAQEIPKMVKPIVDNHADFVAADRFTDPETGKNRRPSGMPVGKYYANKLGSRIVGKLSKTHFRDVTCGFRAYNRKAMLSLNINSPYTYTQESFQVLATKKMRIQAMPVSIKYYLGRKSRVVKSFMSFLFGSAINILRAYRDYAPMKFFGTLGMIFFIPGIILVGFVVRHWLVDGALTPYKALGFIGGYLVSLAIFLWCLMLIADMYDRMINNQEKILEEIKEVKYRR